MTDFGGIQEEAAVLGKPVLVLRYETEPIEGVSEGLSKLVGTDSTQIFNATEELLGNEDLYQKMARKKHIYGDGKAAQRISEIIMNLLEEKT